MVEVVLHLLLEVGPVGGDFDVVLVGPVGLEEEGLVLAPGEGWGDDDAAAVLEVAKTAGVGYALFMNIDVGIIKKYSTRVPRWGGGRQTSV